MKNSIIIFSYIFPLLFVGVVLHCSTFNGNGITGTGSHAGNGLIIGTIVHSDGTPAKNAEVFIRSKTYLRDLTKVSQKRAPDIVTDIHGVFSIDSVKPGDYSIEINENNSNAVILECRKDSSDTHALDLGTSLIQIAASLRGKVNINDIPKNVSVYVQIYGMEYIQKVNERGEFSFPAIPAGQHTIKISSEDTSLGTIDKKLIKVKPGEKRTTEKFTLPYSFWRDTAIVRILLDNNNLSNISVFDVISNKKDGRITGLNLTGRGIKTIPPQIKHLMLTHLYLGNNFIDSLPYELSEVSTLTYLELARNKLRKFSGHIGKFTKLKHLDLSENNLHYLYKGFEHFESLETLKLEKNNLHLLPKGITSLTKLKLLDISHNQLKRLPKETGNLTGIEILDLSHNHLKSLPSGIITLTGLSFLSVNYNYLSTSTLQIVEWLDTYSTADEYWKDTQQYSYPK